MEQIFKDNVDSWIKEINRRMKDMEENQKDFQSVYDLLYEMKYDLLDEVKDLRNEVLKH